MAKGSRNRRLTAMFSCLMRMKSRMVSITVALGGSIVSLGHFYVKFCKETTLHGLKHTVAENYHWSERKFFYLSDRWLWFVLTGIAFYGAVYCGLSQLSRYNSEPLVVSLQRDFRSWWTLFPAVTACFLDRVQPDKARSVIESTWNVTEDSDPERYQYYYSFIELVTDVSFRTNLQNFWKYQTDETVKNIDLLQLALNVHPKFPLKVTVCKKEKDVVWIPVMTEMGICMTFNSEYAVYQFLLQELELDQEPLLQCHYHSAQCYVRIETFNNAVRYFVHSPYDIPSAISNPTGEVLPGEEVVIDFKVIEIEAAPGVKNLRLDQRRCRYPDEWMSGAIKTYSYGLCQMHCRSRMAVMFCGCRPYFHVRGASLGGTTALFVGASVLTVVETVFFIITHFVKFVIKGRKKSKTIIKKFYVSGQ